MIDAWWWKAIGVLLFLGAIGAMFLNMYDIRIVTVKKEKAQRTLDFFNHKRIEQLKITTKK